MILQYLNTRKGVDGNWDLNAPLIKNQMPSGKFSSASLQQCFKKMYESVGIDASSHSGRRSFCTNLSENGISITNLQTLMGHQSISTTALYINENPKILGKISEDYSLWKCILKNNIKGVLSSLFMKSWFEMFVCSFVNLKSRRHSTKF